MKFVKIFFYCIIINFFTCHILFAEIFFAPDIDSAIIKLDQYIDLADLEYDDHPYPGRTNLGHIFIPYLQINSSPVQLNLGGWYKHVYIQYDKSKSPERMYPYMNAVFFPWNKSEFLIGNYPNLAKFPNTIYNEFLFFEERPVSSGLKFTLQRKTVDFTFYIDWIKLDTEEHPEEFITGLIFNHNIFENFYYKFFNHYHHKGGQLNKDSHPVRIEQDIATSPVIGFNYKGFYTEAAYYLSSFSQNFEATKYGHAGSGTIGYLDKKLNLSYQCFYNNNYYHGDAHIFYLKKSNVLHRLRLDLNIFRYKEIVDIVFTTNLYGIDPPGIDFRIFAKINLDLAGYRKDKQDYENSRENNIKDYRIDGI